MMVSKILKRCTAVLLSVSLLSGLILPVGKAAAAGTPTPPSVGAYTSGIYRNLFAEAGKSQAEIDAKVEKAFNQLFYGNNDTERVFYPVGTDKAYILDVGDNDVRSEGMSYGMMICVQLNKQKEFNMLWKWAKENMYHADGQFKGFFAWQCNTSGGKIDNTPASDGEEYFATSLFFASHRWGDGTGIFNYKAEAQALLNAMLHQADDGQGVNMFDKTQKQVVFCPIGNAATFTDPSYHLPSFYELWALWADKDNTTWSEIASTSRLFFQKTTHATTGLAPDYANFDGSPKYENGHQDFKFDAWRVAGNIGMDYSWWAKDSWQKTFADRIQNFFYNQGITSYGNNFTISGTKTSSDHSPGLVAMNAVASLAATTPKAYDFVNELYNLQPPSGTWRYYDGMLYMMAMLHCSGKFVVWKPGGSEPTPTPVPIGKKISGYVAPNFTYTSEAASSLTSGFKVEVAGTQLSATTTNGRFEITNVPASSAGYTVRISKPGYLTREINNVVVASDVALGTASAPVTVLAGDFAIQGAQDGAINMSDIMEVASTFNATSTSPNYKAVNDLNMDNAINMADIMIVASSFNKTGADYPPVIPTSGPTSTPTTAPTIAPTPTSVISSPSPGKLVALTFDDGPDVTLTPKVLDRLEKYKVPATFFQIGQKINDSTKPVEDRILALGCEIGNHSWGYDGMNGMTAAQIQKSIADTNAAILRYTGTTPKFFRPPNLSTSQTMFDAIDLTFCSGVTANDWSTSTTAQQRANDIINGVKDGSIILLHDVQPLPHPTPEALDIIIPTLKSRGYEFVTLTELFKRKGVTLSPTDNKMYTAVPY